MKIQKALAMVLSLMIICSGLVFCVSAETVTPLRIVKYNQDSVINDWDHKADNVAGGFCYGTAVTAAINEAGNAVDATATNLTGNNYVMTYFDSVLPALKGNQYYFAVLYQTEGSVISGGYYSSNKTGGLVSTDAANRPGFSTQSISIGGESYYLTTALLDMSTSTITSGTNIHGLRLNLPSQTLYSIYAVGVFSGENDAATYFQSDITSPTIVAGMALSVSNITDSSMDLSWVAASDDTSAAANITYKVYANSSVITAATLSSATLAAMVTGTTSATASMLAADSTYYFAIQAVDEAGNTALWCDSVAYQTTALGHQVTPLAFVDYDSDSPIITVAGSATAGCFYVNGNAATVSYDAAQDAVAVRFTQGGAFVCNFDETCVLNAEENATVYAAILYTGSSLPNDKGFLMNGLGSDGQVYNTGYTRPTFTTSTISVGGTDMKLAVAEINVAADGYDGKTVYGIRSPWTASTFQVHASGVFASYSDMVAILSDVTAPVMDGESVEVAGSGLDWQLSWDAAADAVTSAGRITYKIYVSEDEMTAATLGTPAVTVRGVTSTTLIGLAAQSDNYISITAEDDAGNVALALNVYVITTGKATAWSYTSYNEDSTLISTDLSDLIGPSTIMTAANAEAEYDEDTGAVKVTLTASGDDYFCAYFDTTYVVDSEVVDTVTLTVLYQSDRDIAGNGFLLPSFSSSVANYNNSPLKQAYSSKQIQIGGETYKVAYTVIDVTEHSWVNAVSGLRVPSSLGTNAGTDFIVYGAGAFPTLADAIAAYSDSTAPVFAPEVSVDSRTYAFDLTWQAATDNALNDDSIQYTVYLSESPITTDTLGAADVSKILMGATGITISDLTPDTAYYYAVLAKDAAGNQALWSSVATVSTLKKGDIDADGTVTATDLTLLKKQMLNIAVDGEYDFDVNGDGEIDIRDMVALKKVLSAAS